MGPETGILDQTVLRVSDVAEAAYLDHRPTLRFSSVNLRVYGLVSRGFAAVFDGFFSIKAINVRHLTRRVKVTLIF